ncbi:MAG: ParA family protein [Eubacteriales bacterium]
MARIIAVVNQKGGVGKTTTAVNLATALTMQKKKVLLCDFDPQANATTGMGLQKRTKTTNIYDVILGDKTPHEGVISTRFGDVLPSNQVLAGAGMEMYEMKNREFLLREALRELELNYDFIFIDCPPSLELLTVNGLTAAHGLLVPVQCEYYALEGLADLMNTVRLVKQKLNPELELEGVLLTMYDGRTNLSTQVAEEVKRYFPQKVFSTVIPRNVRLSEAPSHGEPIQIYDPHSRGAEAYGTLAKEVVKMQSQRLVRR